MSELKPCPFCGGEARFETYGDAYCAVVCQSCNCGTNTMSFDDGMRAVAAWNRRAERTGTLRHVDWDDGQCTWGCKCSACGYRFEHETGVCWHYCPYCGARIERGGE